MELTELELTNWGPFYGTHVVPLSVTPHAPVILFRGENMRGKTSLLRAIVWALYGQIREQDGKTPLDVGRMVNLDALAGGEADFGVRLKFAHAGTDYTLYRTSTAIEERPGRARVSVPRVDLKPAGSDPYPAAQVADVVSGILSSEVSDFFLFDGEMLNRFEERLREERSAPHGFVRNQVERALGLPFLNDLGRDLDAVLSEVTSNIDLVVRRAKAHDKESDAYRAKNDELTAIDRDLAKLREHDDEVSQEIEVVEAQLAKVDEIKEAYYRRKSLEKELDASHAAIDDYRAAIAEKAEATWWLPLGDQLLADIDAVEARIMEAEERQQSQLFTRLKIEQIEGQISSGHCPTCGQSVATHDEDELLEEVAVLRASLEGAGIPNLDELRLRRSRLRRFASAPTQLGFIHNQEMDIRKEAFRNDKRQQEIRTISEQLAGTKVEIDVLERRYVELKSTKVRYAGVITGLEAKRASVKLEVNKLGSKLAEQPEVDPVDRELQKMAAEGVEVVSRSFDGFRSSMRERVEFATSVLFRKLTTEKEYSGVAISDDYHLAVTDHQGRPLSMISAGANQILTMAFIGALGECSVNEAPMVMDTPFGRLDVGHRRAILEWVGGFDRQVILFVQSGEYDPTRDSATLAGKIGREYVINRLTPSRSEVAAA
ncbi:AAA family ATPase [Microbacterium sp.]|uniref:AAA family ATPase n=1 Tax=Microbacterium sp. TaxID=51671 RepID=UPI002810BFF6|nr:AAA family ATPase [Microbacterium sp.]